MWQVCHKGSLGKPCIPLGMRPHLQKKCLKNSKRIFLLFYFLEQLCFLNETLICHEKLSLLPQQKRLQFPPRSELWLQPKAAGRTWAGGPEQGGAVYAAAAERQHHTACCKSTDLFTFTSETTTIILDCTVFERFSSVFLRYALITIKVMENLAGVRAV